MPIDVHADPWGAALLATATAGLLFLLVVTAASLGRRRSTGARIGLGLSMLGFHGSAVAGAAANLERDDVTVRTQASVTEGDAPERAHRAAADSSPDAEPDPAAAPETAEAAPEPDADSDEPPEAGETDGAAEAEEPAGEVADEDPTQAAAPEPTIGSKVPAVAPLPDDPEELRTAARLVLREGKRVASSNRTCKDPEAVATAWAALQALPDDLYDKRQQIIAKRLDKCRRKIVWATSYSVGRDRTQARAELAKAIETRWVDERDLRLFTSASGEGRENLRIGSTNLDEATVQSLWTPAFERELAEAGFAQVTWSDGKQVWRYPLEPTPDEMLVQAELTPWGLHDPLTL